MKVILIKDFEKLGNNGDIVEVKDGYARNYLIPRKICIPATPENLRKREELLKLKKLREEREKQEALRIASKIRETEVEIFAKAGEEGRLFGAIGSLDIVSSLKEKGIEIEKGMVRLEEPLRVLGEYEVEIRLHPEVAVPLKVVIKRIEENP